MSYATPAEHAAVWAHDLPFDEREEFLDWYDTLYPTWDTPGIEYVSMSVEYRAWRESRPAHADDCRYCEAGEGVDHTYEPPIN